jgi:hypothetical protein
MREAVKSLMPLPAATSEDAWATSVAISATTGLPPLALATSDAMVLTCAATIAACGGVTYAPSAFSTSGVTGSGSTEGAEPERLVSVMMVSF